MKPIAFLSDLGTKDDAVGMCKGLMAAISPGSQIIDITHEVQPFDVAEGARYLADAPRYFPAETVFAVVVIPETGSGLDHVAVCNRRDQWFVAPNNGVLSLALPRKDVVATYQLTGSYSTGPHCPTFDGRDVIAYAAAMLASGAAPSAIGARGAVLRRLELPQAVALEDGALEGCVSIIDKNFGSVWTNIPYTACNGHASMRPGSCSVKVTIGERSRVVVPYVRTFSDVPTGAPLAYVNSRGFLALAVNRGRFVDRFPSVPGERVRIAIASPSLVGTGDTHAS